MQEQINAFICKLNLNLLCYDFKGKTTTKNTKPNPIPKEKNALLLAIALSFTVQPLWAAKVGSRYDGLVTENVHVNKAQLPLP